jgi:large subunit ribosomal protein L29
MKTSELREMSKDELLQKVKDLREALFNLEFQHATGQLENTAQLKKTRKDIARALTIMSEADRTSAARG